jgi:hypothetical protein
MTSDVQQYRILDSQNCSVGRIVYHAKTRCKGMILSLQSDSSLQEGCYIQWSDGVTEMQCIQRNTYPQLLIDLNQSHFLKEPTSSERKDKSLLYPVSRQEFDELTKKVDSLLQNKCFCSLPKLEDIESSSLKKLLYSPQIRHRLIEWKADDWKLFDAELTRVQALNRTWIHENQTRVAVLEEFFKTMNEICKSLNFDQKSFELNDKSLIYAKPGLVMKCLESQDSLVQHQTQDGWEDCFETFKGLPFRVLRMDTKPEIAFSSCFKCSISKHRLSWTAFSLASDDELMGYLITEKLGQ